jgi:hypothetical protein
MTAITPIAKLIALVSSPDRKAFDTKMYFGKWATNPWRKSIM